MSKKLFSTTIIFIFLLCFTLNQAQAIHADPTPVTYSKPVQTYAAPGSLIKGASDAIYYLGSDDKRYVFPNYKTYRTWFISFNTVVVITDNLLWSKPLGGNVTYKPGIRLVKIISDPKVYYVDKIGTLRHVATESVANQLFGNDWQLLIDDIPVSFFINYQVGQPISTPELPTIETAYSINQDKLISNEPDTNFIKEIDLDAGVSGNTVSLKWFVNFNSAKGYKVVKSTEINPVYPGNEYHYISDFLRVTDTWTVGPGTYHFRVCEYTGSGCATYSNDIKVTVYGQTTDNTNGQISLNGYYNESLGKVILDWSLADLYSAKGFKVVHSTSPNPVYPGNTYHYLSDPNVRTDKWLGLAPGTYNFRVCEYLGSACGVYSNNLVVTVPGTVVDNTNGSITLTGSYDASLGKVYLNWALSELYSVKGFKVVHSTSPNPVYPGNEYHYLSDPNVRADKWVGLTPGTYHFRVCEYLGNGQCGVYSNDLTITVTGNVIDNSNGSISLSGNYEASLGKVLLNWSVIDMYSAKGFKVVYSTSPNPVYPGNEYHYLSNPDTRSDKWLGLAPGTYHFRTCEYLGNGQCGVYSNDITVTVQ